MTLHDYYLKYGSRISQASERLFVDEFLFPLVGPKIGEIEPQYVFIDRTGKARRIDFAHHGNGAKIAIEVNGETYHAEGIIPNEMFDDNLFRQNDILRKGYGLIRFSYSQLQSQAWRQLVMDSLRDFIAEHAPSLLSEYTLTPNQVQLEALDSLQHARQIRGWKKGVVVMPTGTGKTILSALDAQRMGGRVLFLVHRLDILAQSMDAYRKVWGRLNEGLLTGVETYNERDCQVLFASKDTLRQPEVLATFAPDYFDYLVVDEVHHGQSPSYQGILKHFRPRFMLGMTATPDRTDRKDIFELFDYNKAYEIPLSEVIERGYLVPFTYIGLTDDIDYTKIRFQNNHYRVDDLERQLIIPERNKAILDAYVEPTKGAGDKAIGFCVSIAHADRMAEYFIEQGVAAAAVYSGKPDRDQVIASFRNDELQVVFTVDLFNEGMDFPNVRVLLFLRPTESKTVFLQQLGRGLRLCSGKDRVRVLDFIGNYKRANQIRKYLSKSSAVEVGTDENGRRTKKVVYEYSTGCEVNFDESVEEILNRQDASELEVDRDDLKEAYFALAETLQRKPTKQDLDGTEYPSRYYTQEWGTWLKFLQAIGEYTEALYHYPQAVHLGHILAILEVFGSGKHEGSAFDDKYIRLRGGYGQGRLGVYQRSVKFKLQAAMELGLIEDDRHLKTDEVYQPRLTVQGETLYKELRPLMKQSDLHFPVDADGIPSTRMALADKEYTSVVKDFLTKTPGVRASFMTLFLTMPAVSQMLGFLYQIARRVEVPRHEIYREFFKTPFVRLFCEQEGIDEVTEKASRRRCPFLLSILAACGVVQLERETVRVTRFLIAAPLVRSHRRESLDEAKARAKALAGAWPTGEEKLHSSDVSILRELFGRNFLTEKYHITDCEYIEL